MKTSKIYLLLLLGIFLLVSCERNEPVDPESSIEKLIITDGFTFQSTLEKEIKVILPATVDFTELRSRVDVYDDSPENGGVLLSSTAVLENGESAIKVKIPTSLEQLYINTMAGSQWIDLSGLKNQREGEVVIDFNESIGFDQPAAIDGFKGTATTEPGLSGVRLKDQATVVNLVQNGDFSLNSFGLISDWSSPMVADGKWYITSTLGPTYAKQYVSGSDKFLRKTSSPARYGGVAQLVPAHPGDLITFTSNVRSYGNTRNISWLFLIPRNSSGSSIGFYSIQTNNTNNVWLTRTIAASMPAGTAYVQILLWSHVYGGVVDYDNVIVTGPVTDSDGDGVDNELDEYPDDANRAFNVFYPNANTYATLAFEDLWPGKGDYDFNDLILDYRVKQVLNASNKLVEFYFDYSVRAIGAAFENGFGLEIPGTTPSTIGTITGTQLTENYISLNANGTEAGQDKAVLILFDNAYSRMNEASSGFGINTSLDAPWVEPVFYQVYVSLATPVLFQNTARAPFNPFLIVNKERGKEVHLPGDTPTSLADLSLLGTWFDASNPTTGKYYQSAGNLPWAIDVPQAFSYVIEKNEIVYGHLKFGTWAESGGVSYTDWYKNLANYRNAALIYTHQ